MMFLLFSSPSTNNRNRKKESGSGYGRMEVKPPLITCRILGFVDNNNNKGHLNSHVYDS